MANTSYYAKKKEESDKKIQAALEAREKRTASASVAAKKEAHNSKIESALNARSIRIQNSLPDLLADIQNRFNTEINYYSSTKPAYGAYEDTYKSQRERRLNISDLRKKVNAYRSYMQDGEADSILSALDQMDKGYDAYLGMSQYDSEEAYNAWLAEEKDYEEKLAQQKTQGEKLWAGKTEEEWLAEMTPTQRAYHEQSGGFVDADKSWEEKVGFAIKMIQHGDDADYAETDKLLKQLKTAIDKANSETSFSGLAKANKEIGELQGYYNQLITQKNADILSKTKMEGTNRTVLEEAQLLAEMDSGEEKDKRKAAVIREMEKLGIPADDYALFTDDSNFSIGKLGQMVGNAWSSGWRSFASSVASTGDLLFGNLLDAAGWEDNPFSLAKDFWEGEYATSKLNNELAKEQLGGGDAWQYTSDAVEGVAGAVPYMIAAFASGGATAANDLTKKAAYETGNILTKAGLTVSSMMKNPSYWLSVATTLGTDYEEAKNMGASDEVAALGAVATSLINAGIEIGPDGASGIQGLPQELAEEGGSKLLKWIVSSIEEGGEEGLQKFVSESVAKTLYNHDLDILDPSEYAREMSLGTISGMALGGGQIGVETAVNAIDADIGRNKYIRRVYGADPSALVGESLEIDPNNAFAQKMQGRLDSGKKLSAGQLNRLVQQNEAALTAQDMANIQSAAENRLTELGETGDVSAIAAALTKQTAGEKLTGSEQKLISSSKYGQRVANELKTAEWAQKLDTQRINVQEYSRLLEATQQSQKTADVVGNQVATEDPKVAQPTQVVPVEAPSATIRGNRTVEDSATGKESLQVAEESSATEEPVTKAVTLEDASKKYGAQAQAMIHTFTAGQDVAKYDKAYQVAYDMGKSGVSFDYVKGSQTVSYLSDTQKELAYEAGQAASNTETQVLDAENKAAANGKTGRRKGVVKGEGVTITDLKKTFNDPQGKAYKYLSAVAEATGIDIVLYRSEAGADGKLQGAQGRFSRSDPGTIYIDLNAGLTDIKSADDLAKYAMLRTFAHEFTHFIEKWNPIQYNELRKVVFDTLTQRGENVHDLIEDKQARNPGMSYDKASREVVAEAMTDILPDANFVQTLAEKHENIFTKLLAKLKEFVKNLREYFNSLGMNPSRESNALKEQVGDTVKYLDSIVQLFDKAAVQAVENYQLTIAVDKTTGETSIVETKVEVTVEETAPEVEKTTPAVEETQGVPFDKKTDSYFKRASRVVVFEFEGQKFVSDGKLLVSASDAGIAYAKTAFNANDMTLPNMIQKTFSNATTLLTEAPMEAKSGSLTLYEFTVGEKKLRFNKKLFSFIDGGLLYYADYNGGSIIKSVNRDGSIKGYLFGMRINDKTAELTDIKPTKLKSFSNKMQALIDSQTAKSAVLNGIDDGEQEQSRSYLKGSSSYKNISKQEWRQIQEDRMEMYGSKFDEMPVIDITHAHDILYVFENFDETHFGVIERIDPAKNKAKADIIVEVFNNGPVQDIQDYRGRFTRMRNFQKMRSGHHSSVRNRGTGAGNARLVAGTGASSDGVGMPGTGSSNQDEQFQQRTNTLTDRDILEIAEKRGITETLSAGQMSALQILNKKNAEIGELLNQKAKQEKILKDLQGTAKPDKQEIIKTQNRIKTIDGQIKRESAKLREYEATDTVKGILEIVKPTVEKKLIEERKEEMAKYGTIPQGEKAVRESDLPTTTDGKNKVSRTARTVYEAGVTPEDFAELIDKEVYLNNGLSYLPVYNNDVTQKAIDYIKEEGWEAARGSWSAQVRNGKVSAELSALGALLLNNAAKAGDKQTWLDVLHDYQLMGTNAGQAVQAMRILKTLTPDDSLYMIERSISQMIEDMKLGSDIVIDENLKLAYLDAKDDSSRDAALDALAEDIAKQIPSIAMDKWTALRYLNMLGNFRTQGRNILGNTGMSVTSRIKNVIATGIEWIAEKASGGKFHRTKSLFVSKEQLKAARNDFVNMESLALSGGKFNDSAKSAQFQQRIQDARKIFKFAPLEGYRRATNWAMDKGDLVFSKAAYGRALAGYLKANGITETDFSKIDQQLLDEARAHAIKEAQEATFRDNNWLSDWVSKLGRRKDTPKGVKMLSEGVMPFRKTPANILVRAEEYSPLGIINATVKSIQVVKGAENVTGADVVNSWAKALTGTGLFALGMLLNNSGALSGGPDEDDDKDYFEDQYGWQNYSIQMGDYNFTIDFLSPAAMPLLMGAQLNELRQNGGIELKDLETALLSIADPMIEMSMLQGVNDSLDNIRYAESNMGQFLVNAGLSYLTQGLTNSFLGQVERSLDGQRMSTYIDKDSDLPAWLQKTLGKASAKIPGWDFQQIPYVNAWGETEDIAPLPAMAENTLSPSYISEGITDEVYEELSRLNDAQSDINVYPQIPDKTVTFTDADGNRQEDYNLSAEEYVVLAKAQGHTQRKLVESIIASNDYALLTDIDKAKTIEYAYKYAREKAQIEVLNREGYSSDWMAEIEGDVAEAILRKVATGTTEKYTDLSISAATYVKDLLKDITPETGYSNVRDIQKLETVVTDSRLSENEKESALRDVMGESLESKYNTARDTGIGMDAFVQSYRIYLDTIGEGKKQIVINYYVRTLKMSKNKAEDLYDLFAGKK